MAAALALAQQLVAQTPDDDALLTRPVGNTLRGVARLRRV
jgi:hypothetical protein